jgi:hypothetical protein
MGTIHKYKISQWRVQIRHRGYPVKSGIFETLEDAKQFCFEVESEYLKSKIEGKQKKPTIS